MKYREQTTATHARILIPKLLAQLRRELVRLLPLSHTVEHCRLRVVDLEALVAERYRLR